MKKRGYLCAVVCLIAVCFFLPQKVSAESKQEYNVLVGNVIYTIFEQTEDHDAYAIIDDYAGSNDIVDGVYTIPAEVIYNEKSYPIVGVNESINLEDEIKEVVVPKEFGSKEVKTDYYSFANQVGHQNFFTLPSVEKVTIHAENINIANIYSDGGHLERQHGTTNDSVLKELTIDGSKVNIDSYALRSLEKLEKLEFSKDCQVTLNKYGIINCSKLTQLILPAKTKFTEGAISLCNNLNTVKFEDGSKYTNNEGIISPAGTLLFVPANVKQYQTSTKIKKIGDLAFSNCSKLTSVTFRGKTIGEYAFYDCKALTKVKLLESVYRIESYAFARCNLKSIEIPKSVKSIGHGILYNNENLRSIKVTGNYFKVKGNVLTTKSGKTLVTIIPKDGVVDVPSGVVKMNGMPVTAPLAVKNLKFPSTLRELYQMGGNMPNLTKITFTAKSVPVARELSNSFVDTGLQYRGYPYGVIYAETKKKQEICVPNAQKQSYKKFIKKQVVHGWSCIIK